VQQFEASMSSESEGKGEPDRVFASAHADARAASAWGSARGALAAVHNLEALLRRSYVPGQVILDLLPELRSGATVLREAFDRATQADAASAGVGRYGLERVAELDELLGTMIPAAGRRDDAARQAGALADALEAAVDLLGLLDRANAPLTTDVRLDLLAQEAGRMSGTARGRELLVAYEPSAQQSTLSTDPVLLGALVSLLVGCVHGAVSGVPIVLRTRTQPGTNVAELVAEARTPTEGPLVTLAIRVMPWIEPSEAVARRLAVGLGATFEVSGSRASLVLPPPRESC
jgi:hypothetical protein